MKIDEVPLECTDTPLNPEYMKKEFLSGRTTKIVGTTLTLSESRVRNLADFQEGDLVYLYKSVGGVEISTLRDEGGTMPSIVKQRNGKARLHVAGQRLIDAFHSLQCGDYILKCAGMLHEGENGNVKALVILIQ